MLAVVKFVFLMHLCIYSTVFIDSVCVCVCVCVCVRVCAHLCKVTVCGVCCSSFLLPCSSGTSGMAWGPCGLCTLVATLSSSSRSSLHWAWPTTNTDCRLTHYTHTHTLPASPMCGIVIITDTTALTCYSALRIYTTLCVFYNL